jgi:hypothetical protein
MRHVRTVEALALLDERLGPDHLLHRAEAHRQVENLIARRVLEPFVVDAGDAVARAVDHVDEVVATVGLAEPVRERNLGQIAGPLERTQCLVEVAGPDEHIEVLGMSFDAGVTREGVCPADEHLKAGLLERAQRTTVEVPLFRTQDVVAIVRGEHIDSRSTWIAIGVPPRSASCCLASGDD